MGNISGETLTLPTGTDVQRFCYDDLNRLTWAGSTGTPPCAGTAITPGSLSGAQYRQTFGYGTLNRLTTGPLGDYSYGDPAHLHAATSVDSYGTTSYSARYDASGNMTCRAPTSSTTCAGSSPTGQQLTWDNEGRLTSWQNAPSSPTSTAQYLYDGEGNRVAQQTTTGGTTTTTVYLGNLESVSTSGGTTTTTTYYYAAGQRIALAVNGTLSYLASDLLGSATVALDTSGTPLASQLYAPYGTTRYANGVMPTDYGFTGQRADASTGLDDYGARYYDPTLGQFTAADTVLQGGGYSLCGLNRYGYVKGNPETLTDPSGNCPQKPQGWKSKVRSGLAALAVFLLQLPGIGLTPKDQALQSQQPASPAESAPQAQNTTMQDGKTTTTGSGGDCGDGGVEIPTEEGLVAVIVSSLGRVLAKVYQGGNVVGVNRQARRHPQSAKEKQANRTQATQTVGSWTAHLEELNMNQARSGLEPFQQRLISLNGNELLGDILFGFPGYSGIFHQPGSQSSGNQPSSITIPGIDPPSDIVPSGVPDLPEVPDLPGIPAFDI